MTTMIKRLGRGERCWPAEIAMRTAGLVPLTLFVLLWRALCRRPEDPIGFVLAVMACLCLWLGLALTLEGAGLLRPVPLPPRALL